MSATQRLEVFCHEHEKDTVSNANRKENTSIGSVNIQTPGR